MNFSLNFHNPRATFNRFFDKATMTYTHTRVHFYCSPYVPMKNGILDQTVKIDDKCVHYKVVYAYRMWSGEGLNFSKDKHPLTTAHWDTAMKVAKGQQLANDIQAFIRNR